MADRDPSSRARLLLAGGLSLGLVVAIVLVLVGGAGEEGQATAADPECLREWNDDPEASTLGIHQAIQHSYGRVQVVRLSTDDGSFAESENGRCTIVFAARALDPEPAAAAQIYAHREWGPLDRFTRGTREDLGALQRDAVARANAVLSEDGRLSPLS